MTRRPSPPGPDDAHARARADRLAAGLAALGAAAFGVVAAVYLISAHTARGQRVENAVLAARRNQLRGPGTAADLLATVSVWSLVATIAAVGVVALVRGRPRLALGAGAVIAVSVMTAEVLKKVVLVRPALDPNARPSLLDNIFPSGHTTIAVATAMAFVLVVPYRMRGPAALAGGVYAAGVGAATLDAGWHRTSEAVGAVFLVLGVALFACGALVWWRGTGRPPERDRVWAYLPLALVVAAAAIVDVVGVPRSLRAIDEGSLDASSITLAYAASLALFALVLAVAMGVLLAALRDVSLDTPAQASPPDTA